MVKTFSMKLKLWNNGRAKYGAGIIALMGISRVGLLPSWDLDYLYSLLTDRKNFLKCKDETEYVFRIFRTINFPASVLKLPSDNKEVIEKISEYCITVNEVKFFDDFYNELIKKVLLQLKAGVRNDIEVKINLEISDIFRMYPEIEDECEAFTRFNESLQHMILYHRFCISRCMISAKEFQKLEIRLSL